MKTKLTTIFKKSANTPPHVGVSFIRVGIFN